MYRTNGRMVTYATPHMFSILIALRQLDDFEEIKDRISDQHSGGKDVADSGDLLALLTFNIAYDTGVVPWEGHRVNLSGCYLGLAFTGARTAEFVDGEKKSPKDKCLEELFGRNAIVGSSGDKDKDAALDESSSVLEQILSQEIVGRGRPKCLCYEDILLMVVRHPETGEDVLAMLIKSIHHKGADNKPKP
ncbi:hypothetical protein B0H65DRAFT_537915 [Neurospora tetraspora]|uniref:Uncharacterized protein n=1 Tax=Neurospora tetraspora TaxID=94610 RepID=A0AAE0JM14_9PEZI|nr:hypothetical protein B0H65DRAFT_537915 [Neurospora tetraspora]